jgi:hypothetical protein
MDAQEATRRFLMTNEIRVLGEIYDRDDFMKWWQAYDMRGGSTSEDVAWAAWQSALRHSAHSAQVEAELRDARNRIHALVEDCMALVEENKNWSKRAESEVTKLKEQNRWIPVEEELPEDGATAEVFLPEGGEPYIQYQTAWIDYDENPPQWINNGEALKGVTHWRPLPEPPSREGDNGPK